MPDACGPLRERVAIVTGAASGIGRATAMALAAAGAKVAVVDLDESGALAVAREIEDLGGSARGIRTDVADEASVAAAVATTVETFGRLDILHNNAAASNPEVVGRDLLIASLDVEVWDTTMAVNLRGPMLGCKHALPHLLAAGGGAIINTSSASGRTGDAVRAAYGASKAGLESLTRYVATQYGKRGVRCNAIAPGVIETPALAANVPSEQLDRYRNATLAPRLGLPEDIASAVVFLASDRAAFINGQILCVDGGLLAHHPVFEPLESS